MKNALYAIAWTTIRSALRSHVIHVLLFLLVLVIFVLPLTIMSDGSPEGLIQVSLTYSLGLVGFLLSLSTLWLGCVSLTDEIETYQVHLVLSKPVSRSMFWGGKLLGILLLQGALLVISAVSIYALTMYRFNYGNFSEVQRKQIHEELLTGRRLIKPDLPDVEEIAKQELQRRIDSGTPMQPGITESMAIGTIRREVLGQMQGVPPNMPRPWVFSNLPQLGEGQSLYLRYRFYVDSASTKDQRMSRGRWAVFDPAVGQLVMQSRGYSEQYKGGSWHQLRIDNEFLKGKDRITLVYENLDDLGKSVVFELADGPYLMLPVTGFAQNYLRVVLLIFLQLAFLGIVACTCGALLSSPVAIFLSFSYIQLGMVLMAMQPASPEDVIIPKNPIMYVLYIVRQIASHIIVSVNEFNMIPMLSKGQLIELSSIGMVILQVLVFRGLPIALIGLFFLRRRELGLVVRR